MLRKQLIIAVTRCVPVAGMRPTFFRVESESKPGDNYLVDVSAYRGNGNCECMRFLHKFEPKLLNGAAPSDYTRCKHIITARLAFADEVIKLLNGQTKGLPKNLTNELKYEPRTKEYVLYPPGHEKAPGPVAAAGGRNGVRDGVSGSHRLPVSGNQMGHGINRQSKAQQGRAKNYTVVRREFLAMPENKSCRCCEKISGLLEIPVRIAAASEIHHTRGKIGDLLTETKFFLPVCRRCHDWIDAHREKAKEMGWLLPGGGAWNAYPPEKFFLIGHPESDAIWWDDKWEETDGLCVCFGEARSKSRADAERLLTAACGPEGAAQWLKLLK